MTGHETRPQSNWQEAELRIWCMGGWWFQVKGGRRRRLDSGAAVTELLKHLAVDVGTRTSRRDLQHWLARKPKTEVEPPSVTTAISSLRRMVRDAADGRDDRDAVAAKVIPRTKPALSEDGTSAEPGYGLESVWVDLVHASKKTLVSDLLPPLFELEPVEGRGVKGDFRGEARWRKEVAERTDEAASVEPDPGGLDPHLKRMTPPISSLTELVPMALDRLGPGKTLSILGPADSGRMHLAEAVEFAARVYCGRTTEEIREQPEQGAAVDNFSAWLPSHLCILDATREVRPEQLERLREIGESREGDLPSLLVVREGPLPKPLALQIGAWEEEDPIQVDAAGPAEVLEAYLIGTVGEGATEARVEDFARLRAAYEELHEGQRIGLRAAVSAASLALKNHAPPRAEDLPEPPSDNFSFEGLSEDQQELARRLSWFGNRPFELADARAVADDEGLGEGQIFGVATKIPGGEGVFELRPQLIDLEPPAEAYASICRYLVEHEKVEPVVERWPGRALRILDRDEIPLEERVRLAIGLFETCRAQGLAARLAEAMARLRVEAEAPLDKERAELWIENARLLAYLDKEDDESGEEVDGLLLEVLTAAGAKRGFWSELRAKARLRRAVVASRRDDHDLARKEAKRAGKVSSMTRKVESFFGWEALNTGFLEWAVAHFERALSASGGDEERADAAIGLARSLIRLDRPREAEDVIKPLHKLDLRRHTRERLARVSAALCDLRGDPIRGIDAFVDPALLDSGTDSAAGALLFEASAYLHLQASEINAAREDVERSRSVLQVSGSTPDSSGRYVRALIYEAEALAERGPRAAELVALAGEEADSCIGGETERDPWSRARVETLRARLALSGEGRQGLANSLREAQDAHRRLGVVGPELAQTLKVARRAAVAWGAAAEQEEAERLLEQLDPSRSLRRPRLEDVLESIETVVGRIEAGPPSAPEAGAGVELLGRVGETIVEATRQARLAGLRLQILVPRATYELAPGVYEPAREDGRLRRVPASPAKPLSLIADKDEARAVQRYSTCLLLASTDSGDHDKSLVAVGEWIALVRRDGRSRGVSVGDATTLAPRQTARLLGAPPAAAVALPLAQLDDLT